MNTNRLFKLLSSKYALPTNFRAALEKALSAAAYPKGHQLVQAQVAAHHAYFLEKGFALSFQYLPAKRVVTDFWKEGEIIVSPRSFFDQLPTDEIVQLATDSELLSISYRQVIDLFERFPVANHLARDIMVDYYARCKERIMDIHTLDNWTRYNKLLAIYPGIELNVTQEYIASYLNITPQTLSRIKAEHM